MTLRNLIHHYFGGNRLAFSRTMGVGPKTVYRWLRDDAMVAQGHLYLKNAREVQVPDMPFHDRRDQFETQMALRQPGVDLARAGDTYLLPTVEYAWQGWRMAQEFHADEALGRATKR